MRVFISGISGTGMGPLSLMAKAAGMEVFGTDLCEGDICPELVEAGIEMKVGPEAQDGKFLREKLEDGEDSTKTKKAAGVDWFVYTSALPEDQAELKMAREAGIKCTKRDDFTAYLIEKLGLKLVAVAGTHGKTTTTAMIVWAAKQLGIPTAYIVGSTLSFAPSGAYHKGDEFFVYEADEYDRNFLKFWPWLAVVTAVSYDHADIYATREEYVAAFRQFLGQSDRWITQREKVAMDLEQFSLAGEARRKDAALAAMAVQTMSPVTPMRKIERILNEFPGVGRRFERLEEGIYTDYAHHPEEIVATLEIAREEAQRKGFSGVVAIYEPHQNTRQHEVRGEYREAFLAADKVFWLPTYLTREDPALEVLTPADLIAGLANKEVAEAAEMGDKLFEKIIAERKAGKLVLLMTAGPADGWLRGKLKKMRE